MGFYGLNTDYVELKLGFQIENRVVFRITGFSNEPTFFRVLEGLGTYTHTYMHACIHLHMKHTHACISASASTSTQANK